MKINKRDLEIILAALNCFSCNINDVNDALEEEENIKFTEEEVEDLIDRLTHKHFR